MVDSRVELVFKLSDARVRIDALVVGWVSISIEIDDGDWDSLTFSARPVGTVIGLAKLKRWWNARGVWMEDASVIEDIVVALVTIVRPEYALLAGEPQVVGGE